jgi:ribosomal 30S subunit maturation factor RimM
LAADLVTVGRVGKPHGLQGAFVVEHGSEDPERFAVGATLIVEGAPAEILESKRAAGSYYVFQLVGLAVEEEGGRALGHVAEVTPGPANDVLELDTGHALPLVDACVQEVDLDSGRILVRRGFAGAE